MSLRYSVIGRGGQVLVFAGNGGGNVALVVEDLLSRINADADDRKSYTADGVTFHYIVSSKIVFLCVADEAFPVTQAYHYLQTLQNEWTRYYGARSLTVSPSTANSEFGRKMASLMQPNAGSSAPSSSNFGRSSPATGSVDKVEMVSRQIEDVKKQMIQNLDTVLARGEGIEALVESTSSLNTNAAQFKKTAVQLKRHMWWKNAKCWIILGIVLVVIAFAVALIICKGNFKTCGGKSKSSPHSPPPHAPPPPTPEPHAQPPPPTTTPPPPQNPPPVSPPVTPPVPHPEPVSAPTPVAPPPVASPPHAAPVTVHEPEISVPHPSHVPEATHVPEAHSEPHEHVQPHENSEPHTITAPTPVAETPAPISTAPVHVPEAQIAPHTIPHHEPESHLPAEHLFVGEQVIVA